MIFELKYWLMKECKFLFKTHLKIGVDKMLTTFNTLDLEVWNFIRTLVV